uniref:Agouti domain-containing protein n=1 Tax=Stegastes partitus TaxID=144197 RepID=A0A3B5AAI9_9TELE
MKLALLCLCIVHLAFVSCRVFGRNNPEAAGGHLPVSRTQVSPSAGSSNQGRVRPLFARRGQYERQMVYMQKPRLAPVAPTVISAPAKVAPKPAKPKCSQLTQSCLPQAGCCDPCATCHCRFFNAICFCRRTSSQYEKKAEHQHTKTETKINSETPPVSEQIP